MMNRNPFELRTDLLAMAKDYMDKQSELNMALASQAIETLNKESADYVEQVQKLMPKTYTMEEWLEKANELYSFVSKK